MSTTPSAAALLIDALEPKQRAILYVALLSYKNEVDLINVDHQQTNTFVEPLARRISDFYRWNVRESKEILNTLFADCFPEDLQPLQYFLKDLPADTTSAKIVHMF